MWYRPEPKPGRDKFEPVWKDPGIVLQRVGNHSYVVEVKKGRKQEAHRSQLRPHIEDEYNGKPFPLYYFSGKAPTVDQILAPDEHEVESVVTHGFDKHGELKLKIRWQGYGPGDDTWEPASHVVSEVVRRYLTKNGLKLTLAKTVSQPTTAKHKPKPKPTPIRTP